MTPRLFLLWLICGARTVIVAAGTLAALIVAWLIAMAYAKAGLPYSFARELAMMALAQLAVWCAAAVLLATGVWAFLHSLLAAFDADGGR